jgi:hypothetical protein
MRGASRILALWAVLVGALAVMAWIWQSDKLPGLLLTIGALVIASTAALLALAGAGGDDGADDTDAVRLVPELSVATMGVGIAVPMILIGLGFGLYLVLIGAGILALSIGGLIREHLAERETRARIAAAASEPATSREKGAAS